MSQTLMFYNADIFSKCYWLCVFSSKSLEILNSKQKSFTFFHTVKSYSVIKFLITLIPCWPVQYCPNSRTYLDGLSPSLETVWTHILKTAPSTVYIYILHIVLLELWIKMEKTSTKDTNSYTSVTTLVGILAKLLHL